VGHFIDFIEGVAGMSTPKPKRPEPKYTMAEIAEAFDKGREIAYAKNQWVALERELRSMARRKKGRAK